MGNVTGEWKMGDGSRCKVMGADWQGPETLREHMGYVQYSF